MSPSQPCWASSFQAPGLPLAASVSPLHPAFSKKITATFLHPAASLHPSLLSARMLALDLAPHKFKLVTFLFVFSWLLPHGHFHICYYTPRCLAALMPHHPQIRSDTAVVRTVLDKHLEIPTRNSGWRSGQISFIHSWRKYISDKW